MNDQHASDHYASVMTTFPLLEGFTLAGANMLLEAGEIRRYAPGQLLFKEDDPPEFAALLLSGTFQVFLKRGEGEFMLVESEPGTILGELGVICGIPRSASVRAKGECVVLLWKAKDFGKLLLRHNVLADRVLGQSLRNLIQKERSLVDALTRGQPAS